MKKRSLINLLLLAVLLCFSQIAKAQDWPELERYQKADRQLKDSAAVIKAVYMGDSITDYWVTASPGFFKENNYVGRGISGQTSPQMLLRFRQDVISLRPKIVLLLCGTNDIAGNTGPETLEMIEDNIRSMSDVANANGIRMILCSVLPSNKFYWNPDLQPADSIIALNARIKAYAKEYDLMYVDYYTALVDNNKGMKKEYSADGVHPTKTAYAIMERIAQQAIDNQ